MEHLKYWDAAYGDDEDKPRKNKVAGFSALLNRLNRDFSKTAEEDNTEKKKNSSVAEKMRI
jgi:hypothetical protein